MLSFLTAPFISPISYKATIEGVLNEVIQNDSTGAHRTDLQLIQSFP